VGEGGGLGFGEGVGEGFGLGVGVGEVGFGDGLGLDPPLEGLGGLLEGDVCLPGTLVELPPDAGLPLVFPVFPEDALGPGVTSPVGGSAEKALLELGAVAPEATRNPDIWLGGITQSPATKTIPTPPTQTNKLSPTNCFSLMLAQTPRHGWFFSSLPYA
jgi:hypothetical protein